MAVSRSLRLTRLTLVAGVLTAVYAPLVSSRCVVGASTTDVDIHTNDDQTEFRTLALGFERDIKAFYKFRPEEIAFWLKSTNGGLVILEWAN